MHTYIRTTLFALLAIAINLSQLNAKRHHGEPPSPSPPDADDDIGWGLRTFIALVAAGVVRYTSFKFLIAG
jgi:hypothetical protein